MCPIGQGMIDYKAVADVLDEIDYNGYITIEQECDPPCLTAGQLLESGLFAAAIKGFGRPFLLFFRWIDAKSITVLHEITAFHALL